MSNQISKCNDMLDIRFRIESIDTLIQAKKTWKELIQFAVLIKWSYLTRCFTYVLQNNNKDRTLSMSKSPNSIGYHGRHMSCHLGIFGENLPGNITRKRPLSAFFCCHLAHIVYTGITLVLWVASTGKPTSLEAPLFMMTSSNGNLSRVTGPLCGEFTVHRWIPLTKASDAELWCFLWYAPEYTVEKKTIVRLMICHVIALIMN